MKDDTAQEAVDREADLDTPVRKLKRKASTSPNARTLAECRKRGWIAQTVERPWNPHTKVTLDLFGVIDIVAIVPSESPAMPALKPGYILAIQATASAAHHAHRRTKILAEPRAKAWVEAGGRLELWSWSKRGDRGKQKRWTLRVETYEHMVQAADAVITIDESEGT